MVRSSKVFVLILSGQESEALSFAGRRYPDCEAALLSKKDFRECGWKTQISKLHQLKGEALLIFVDSLESLPETILLKWTALFHRCRETIIADGSGAFIRSPKARLPRLIPSTLIALMLDGFVLVFSWVGLRLFQVLLKTERRRVPTSRIGDIAFLYPFQGGLSAPGGAFTHVTGFLSGLSQEGARVSIISSGPIKAEFEAHVISGLRLPHLFRETAALAFNATFARSALKSLQDSTPRLIYQRHGKFQIVGALLSRRLRIPLVLEYNASEAWISRHWDPTRFSAWLKLCEAASIQAASFLVVVSHPLKNELVGRGVQPGKILVNPNGVDPEWFHPGCGGEQLRRKLGFQPGHIVVCFVGTFSYYHGVGVLQQAIKSLLEQPGSWNGPLRFLLVGDGLLAAELRQGLQPYLGKGLVVFTGTVPHKSIRTYLDAADILVSPHVPLPGNIPFFGSPTKLFEYMAMRKAIAASALDQIAEVLEHGKTAFLVKPGDPDELTKAIRLLAGDAQLRAHLGGNARRAVLARHTWRQNARRVLAYCAEGQQDTSQGYGSAPNAMRAPTSEASIIRQGEQ